MKPRCNTFFPGLHSLLPQAANCMAEEESNAFFHQEYPGLFSGNTKSLLTPTPLKLFFLV